MGRGEELLLWQGDGDGVAGYGRQEGALHAAGCSGWLPYFWAGGKISKDKGLLRWENGKIERIVAGVHPWSASGTRGAQPDGGGGEHCLAVLNNFYNVSIYLFNYPISHRLCDER